MCDNWLRSKSVASCRNGCHNAVIIRDHVIAHDTMLFSSENRVVRNKMLQHLAICRLRNARRRLDETVTLSDSSYDTCHCNDQRMLKDSSSPYNNFSICTHKDVERTLLALVDPSERETLIELREHQENVIVQLESLQTSVENLKNTVRNNVKDEELLCTYQEAQEVPRQLIRDMVILAPPSHLPISVVILKSLLQTRFKVKALAHVHSDVKSIDRKLKRIFKDEPSGVGSERRLNYDLGLTLIWKETRFNKVQMIVSNHTPIIGEVNIARYFKRLMQTEGGPESQEDLSGALRSSVLDALMDSISSLLERTGGGGGGGGGGGASNVEKEKAALIKFVAGRLSQQPWISSQNCVGVEDVLVWRCLFFRSTNTAANTGANSKTSSSAPMPKSVSDWLTRCNALPLFQEALELLS